MCVWLFSLTCVFSICFVSHRLEFWLNSLTIKTLYNLQKALKWPRDQYYDRWINLRHHVAMKEQGRNLQLLARVGAWVWCLTTCTGNYTGTTFSVDLIIWTSPQGVCVFFFSLHEHVTVFVWVCSIFSCFIAYPWILMYLKLTN